MSFVLGVDLDGVCGDYVGMFRHFVARNLGVTEESLPAPTQWSFAESGWGIRDGAHYMELHSEAVSRGMFRAMAPMPGVSQELWALSDEDIHIRIITHRLCTNRQHRTAAADTVEWLDLNEIPYRDLCFQGEKTAVMADCYIDDAPHNVEALRAAGGFVIVFDAPYNQHVTGPRARTWQEAGELIRARRAEVEAAQLEHAQAS